MRNYGLRYPFDERESESDNYGSWLPTSPMETFFDDGTGKHLHEIISRDYIPKTNKTA